MADAVGFNPAQIIKAFRQQTANLLNSTVTDAPVSLVIIEKSQTKWDAWISLGGKAPDLRAVVLFEGKGGRGTVTDGTFPWENQRKSGPPLNHPAFGVRMKLNVHHRFIVYQRPRLPGSPEAYLRVAARLKSSSAVAGA